MLEEIYNIKREEIDLIIKKILKENKINLSENEYEKNKELIEKLEENYNIKLGNICKELYLKGLKDGINLIIESKNEKEIKNIF